MTLPLYQTDMPATEEVVAALMKASALNMPMSLIVFLYENIVKRRCDVISPELKHKPLNSIEEPEHEQHPYENDKIVSAINDVVESGMPISRAVSLIEKIQVSYYGRH